MPKTKSKMLSRNERKEVRAIARRVCKKDQEVNFHVFEFQSGVSTTGSIADLSVIVQGVGDEQRLGDSIALTSMEVNFDWIGADETNRCRVIIFRWNDDVAPGVSDILLNSLGTSPQVYTSYVKDGRSKFNVLYDRITNVVRDTAADAKYNKINRKLTGKVDYSAGTTSGVGHIYLLALSDSNNISHPTLTFTSRLNYLA